jgi:hydroxymethylpyrimidine pyrophosphatase-like HAD family hydrolase
VELRLLATDYDGTFADDGQVSGAALAALGRWRSGGRRAVLVTGRRLPDLELVFDRLDLFDAVVAENGALLRLAGETRRLAAPPPPALGDALRRHGVAPLAFGEVIVGADAKQEDLVREALADAGSDWAMILNKDSLMLLPPGVDKASGLAAALWALDARAGETLGVGDAENDLPFLAACGVAAAVANALPTVKSAANIVTRAPAGAGFVELVDGVLSGELAVAV